MLEWSDERWVEYDDANLSHHRTRTYGCLRGVPKPPKEEPGQRTFLGYRNLLPSGYRDDLPLIKSILGKISTPPTGIERWLSIKKGAGPPGLEGAGQLGHSIERDALHKALEQLQKM